MTATAAAATACLSCDRGIRQPTQRSALVAYPDSALFANQLSPVPLSTNTTQKGNNQKLPPWTVRRKKGVATLLLDNSPNLSFTERVRLPACLAPNTSILMSPSLALPKTNQTGRSGVSASPLRSPGIGIVSPQPPRRPCISTCETWDYGAQSGLRTP